MVNVLRFRAAVPDVSALAPTLLHIAATSIGTPDEAVSIVAVSPGTHIGAHCSRSGFSFVCFIGDSACQSLPPIQPSLEYRSSERVINMLCVSSRFAGRSTRRRSRSTSRGATRSLCCVSSSTLGPLPHRTPIFLPRYMSTIVHSLSARIITCRPHATCCRCGFRSPCCISPVQHGHVWRLSMIDHSFFTRWSTIFTTIFRLLPPPWNLTFLRVSLRNPTGNRPAWVAPATTSHEPGFDITPRTLTRNTSLSLSNT